MRPETGELQISLDPSDLYLIKLLRPPADNLIVSFTDNGFPKEELPTLLQTLGTAHSSPTIRAYKFPSLQGQCSSISRDALADL